MSDYNFDNLDRNAGSGSLDERECHYDEGAEREYHNEKRRTSFNPSEGPDSGHWHRLNQVDSGVGDTRRRGTNNVHHQKITIETLCGQLRCTEYQQNRVKYLFDDIGGENFGSYRTETVVMALISLVQNEDVGPGGKDVRDRDQWKSMLIELEIDDRHIRRLRGKFHEYL